MSVVFQPVLAFGIISPWLLLGGLALSAAPIVIHLLHRRRHQDRPWGAMQFLRAAVRKQARRVRVESLILLAVRVLLIVCAAAAVAQPFLTAPGAAAPAGAGRVHHVLVLDASLSMRATTEGVSAFDRARDIALRIVESASPGDAFHLFRSSRTSPQVVISEAAFDAGTMENELRSLSPTEERGDVPGVLRRLLPLLAGAGNADRWNVYLLSDFQQNDWLATDEALREEVRGLLEQIAAESDLVLVDAGAATGGNAAVTHATIVRGPSTNDGGELEATLHNFGRTPLSSVAVELRVDGRVRDVQEVNLPARSTSSVRFSTPAGFVQETVAELRLADDVLAEDSRRWIVLPAAKPLSVLIVSGEPRSASRRRAADFLATALAPAMRNAAGAPSAEGSGAMRPLVIADGELATRDLAPFDCVYLCDVGLISAGEAARLQAYVESGRGLVIALGENVRPASYHEMLNRDGSGLLPVRLLEVAGSDDDAEGFRFDPGDYNEAILRPFAGNEYAGLLTTRIDRYYRIEIESPQRVLLRFAGGDPAIVAHRFGAGRVLLVTTSLDDRWGNWALWPSYLPMMHELTRMAAAADLSDRNLLVGDSIVHRYLPEDYNREVTFVAPGQEPVELRRPAGSDAHQVVTEPILRSGPSELRIGAAAPVVEPYAVNVDPLESDLSALDEATISTELLPDVEHRYVRDWTAAAAARLDARIGRADLTMWFLVAAAGLLFVEQTMAWHFRYGAGLLVAIVVTALVAGAGVRGLLGAALLIALVSVLVARHRRGVRSRPAG